MGDSQRYNTFLIFGPPGSGKGTQGQVLGRLPRFFTAPAETFSGRSTRDPNSVRNFSATPARASSCPMT